MAEFGIPNKLLNQPYKNDSIKHLLKIYLEKKENHY